MTSISLYPALPPTNNMLDPEQRSRLLRSTRKLEAVLGATPQFIDPVGDRHGDRAVFSMPEAKERQSRHPRSHLTTDHHPLATRDRLYSTPSASSSDTSLESTVTEQDRDFVFVKGGPGARSAPYQVVPLVSRSSSPGSSRSASPARPIHRELSILGKKNAQGFAMPMTVAVDIPVSADRKKTKAGPTALAQPMLLRLRALPPDARHTPSSSISSTYSSSSAVSSSASTHSKSTNSSALRTARPAIPPFEFQESSPLLSSVARREGKVDSVLGPLSPLIASLTLAGDDIPPRSPTSPTHSRSISMTTPSKAPVLTDKDKRRKMAKLQRTLGENIPIELVFGAGPGPSSAGPSTKASKPLVGPSKLVRRVSLSSAPALSRSSSTSKSSRPLPAPPSRSQHRSPTHQSTKSLFGGGIGVGSTLPVAEIPVPPPAPIVASEQAHISTSESQSKSRKARPRSLTLGTASAFVKANKRLAEKQVDEATGRTFGTTSLDSGSRPLGSATPFGKLEKAQTLVPPFDTIGLGAREKSKERERRSKEEKRARKSAEEKRARETEWEGRRKEKEWSGEWNVKDMDQVAKQLRNLKL